MPNKPFRDARVVHRRAVINPVGGAGTSVATGTIRTGGGRVVALGLDFTNQAVTTDVVLKRDSVGGTTFFTSTDSTTDLTVRPVGTTAVDEARGPTAATDGFAGGFPIYDGIYYDVAQADDSSTGAKSIILDVWVELDRVERVTLVADAGADGTGTVSRTVNFNGPGNLVAVAIDYTSQPGATADVIIKADDTSGLALFTSTDSATDLAPSLVGRPGSDEARNATAATDGTGAGNVFRSALRFECTGLDIFTTGDEKVVVDVWVKQ